MTVGRNPKIPREQMSKYDFGRGMLPREMKFEARKEHNSVTGCGDPTCQICLPSDGRRGDTRTGGGDRAAEMEALRRMMSDRIFSMDPFSNPITTQREDGSREYRAAKEKVEKYLLQTSHDVQWDDVVGNEAARVALIEAIEHPISHAELYRHYGMKPLKGVLLHGAPGCGKTMFGKAAASVIGRLHGKSAMLLKINGPEIQTPYVGQTEEIIRDIFRFARLYAKQHGHPLTVFIDEADAILPARSGRSAPWEASNVATFLAEMDGMETSGAFVILATNRPEAIDSALLRDGRCDRKIRVERPTRDAALSILAKALRDTPVAGSDADITLKAVDYFFSQDRVISGFDIKAGQNKHSVKFLLRHIISGAMIVGLAGRAKGIAFRRDMATGERSGITEQDLLSAIDEVLRENAGLDHSYAMQEFMGEVSSISFGETLQ